MYMTAPGGLNLPSTSAAALSVTGGLTGMAMADKGERRFSVVKRRMSEAMAKVSRKLLERRARSLGENAALLIVVTVRIC